MKKKQFKCPEKGFEDFDSTNVKNQSSQTFFRIKTVGNALKSSSNAHFRTKTETFPDTFSKKEYFMGK